ncbi:MAG: NAD(P)-dependent oxidoreductase, partial [Bacteroidetes bacterium]|nr:NAD(P)-dependent oxidoreductase [Bacteroidota bacterium]
DATIAPAGPPVCEVITLAKKDLKAGETLDGIGGFTSYGTLENSDTARRENLLPMGLSQDVVLKTDIPKDGPIGMDDVEIPEGRLSDSLWKQQLKVFGKK